MNIDWILMNDHRLVSSSGFPRWFANHLFNGGETVGSINNLMALLTYRNLQLLHLITGALNGFCWWSSLVVTINK